MGRKRGGEGGGGGGGVGGGREGGKDEKKPAELECATELGESSECHSQVCREEMSRKQIISTLTL